MHLAFHTLLDLYAGGDRDLLHLSNLRSHLIDHYQSPPTITIDTRTASTQSDDQGLSPLPYSEQRGREQETRSLSGSVGSGNETPSMDDFRRQRLVEIIQAALDVLDED